MELLGRIFLLEMWNERSSMLNATAGYSWIQPKCVPKCVPIVSINSLCGSPREPEWTGFVEHAGGAGFAGANVNSAAGTKRVLPYDAKG